MLAGCWKRWPCIRCCVARRWSTRRYPTYTGNLLLTFGLLSFVGPRCLFIIQHNYKRLFAYSSIEHMGLAMIGFRGSAGRWGRSPVSFTCSIMRWPRRWRFLSRAVIHRRFETLEINEGAWGRRCSRLPPWRCSWRLLPWSAYPFPLCQRGLLIVSAVAAQDFASDTMEVGRFVTMTISDEMRSLGIVACCCSCRRVVRWVHVSYRDHGLGCRATGITGRGLDGRPRAPHDYDR